MITRLPLTFIELNQGLFNALLCRYNNDFITCLTIDPCQHPAKHSIFTGYTPVFIFQCSRSVHHPTDSLNLQSSHQLDCPLQRERIVVFSALYATAARTVMYS